MLLQEQPIFTLGPRDGRNLQFILSQTRLPHSESTNLMRVINACTLTFHSFIIVFVNTVKSDGEKTGVSK